MPALISAFSSFVGLFNPKYNLTLCLALVQGLKPLFPDGGALWLFLISVGALAIFVPLAIFSAKGKLWCFLTGMGLYALDFGYSFFLFGQGEVTRNVVNVIIHVAFLGAYALGLVFFIKADRLLKAHPKEILGK